MAKHEYADAIVAWAYGEPVQYRLTEEARSLTGSRRVGWVDAEKTDNSFFDFNDTNVEWRPKPRKKTGWMLVYQKTGAGQYNGMFYGGMVLACPPNESSDLRAGAVACIQIEFEEGEGL